MKSAKFTSSLLILFLLGAAIGYLVISSDDDKVEEETSSEIIDENSTDTEDDGNSEENDSESSISNKFFSSKGAELTLTQPTTTAQTSCPIDVAGIIDSPGWFFEAEFTIDLVDENGSVISRNIARATTDWMTSDPIRFVATIDCAQESELENAELHFQKSNASDLVENDDRIIVKFSQI